MCLFIQRLRVQFGGRDGDADIPERTPSPIVLPVDAATSTDELEYDKWEHMHSDTETHSW